MKSMLHFIQIWLTLLIWACFLLFFACESYGFTHSLNTDGTKVLFWKKTSFPVQYFIDQEGIPDIEDKDQAFAAIEQSFEAWNHVYCSCFRFKYEGITEDIELGFEPEKSGKNKNIVFFRNKEWKHNKMALAVTSTVFSETTGQIVAFDMEVNSVNFEFSLTGEPVRDVNGVEQPTADLQNTMTHEAGHALGLDHSLIENSTMYSSSPPGEIKKRSLHQDDISAICSIYQRTKHGNCIVTYNQFENSGLGCSQLQKNPYPFWFSSLILFFLLCMSKEK